ncbi:MAG: hypothetical protein ACF8R7_09465 [Phycisphaerales bacterium JB039]
MTDTTRYILFAVAIPFAACLALGAPALLARSRDDERQRWRWLIAVALGAAAAIAFVGITGLPSEKWQSVMWAPLCAILAGVLAVRNCNCWRLRTAASLISATTALAIWPVVAQEPMWIRLLAPGCALVGCLAIATAAARRASPLVGLQLGVATAGCAAVIGISGSVTLGLPVGAIGTGLLALTLLSLVRRRPADLAAAPFVVIPTLACALVVRWLYASSEGAPIHPAAFALAGSATLGLALATPLRREPSRRARLAGAIAALAVTIGLTAGAIGLALTPPDGDTGDDPYADMYRQLGP